VTGTSRAAARSPLPWQSLLTGTYLACGTARGLVTLWQSDAATSPSRIQLGQAVSALSFSKDGHAPDLGRRARQLGRLRRGGADSAQARRTHGHRAGVGVGRSKPLPGQWRGLIACYAFGIRAAAANCRRRSCTATPIATLAWSERPSFSRARRQGQDISSARSAHRAQARSSGNTMKRSSSRRFSADATELASYSRDTGPQVVVVRGCPKTVRAERAWQCARARAGQHSRTVAECGARQEKRRLHLGPPKRHVHDTLAGAAGSRGAPSACRRIIRGSPWAGSGSQIFIWEFASKDPDSGDRRAARRDGVRWRSRSTVADWRPLASIASCASSKPAAQLCFTRSKTRTPIQTLSVAPESGLPLGR